jgi:2-dehydro-3-deoxygluconokinase
MNHAMPVGATQVVGFGEVLLRLASAPPALLLQEMRLEATFCGAEANVLVALGGFGHRARLITALPDNPVGAAAIHTLGGFGVAVAGPRPAGTRLGLFFLQPGAMARPSAITYDRAGSAFATVAADGYDWPTILAGADWLFVSGITAALGDQALAALRAAIVAARGLGVKVAFDTNFRPALWRGREALAAEILFELSCQADLLFAGRRAIAMMAGGAFDQADPAEGFLAAANRMFEIAPAVQHVAATRRTVFSTDRQDLVGLLADRAGASASPTIALENIVDRVGTGDAFAAGIVHGLASGMDRAETVRFAAACAQWGHSVPGDFLRASLADIAGIMNGGSDVSR